MLKKVEENNFLFFSMVLFCQMALYCVCVVPKQYTIPLLPCSVYDLLVVFCVSCTVKALYKMSKPPSELWYKCLVQYVLLFNEKKRKKMSQSGGGGGWK